VDPINGYTLLHYAVEEKKIAVIRSLLIRRINRNTQDLNNQTAEQLAQQRAGSNPTTEEVEIIKLLTSVKS
jgi:ankyrin repeat protein